MKLRLLLGTIFCIGCAQQSYAQFPVTSGFASSTNCTIRYSYDNAGNRIKREYGCITTESSRPISFFRTADIAEDTSTIVYPNPNKGIFSVKFNTAVTAAYINITDAQGKFIRAVEIKEPTTVIDLDITREAAGIYMVMVQYNAKAEYFKLTKL